MDFEDCSTEELPSNHLFDGKAIGADVSLFGCLQHEGLSLGLVGLLGRAGGALRGEECSFVGYTVCLGLLRHATLVGGVTVQLLQGDDGSQGVGLGLVRLGLGLGWVEDGLDLVTVDQTAQVGVGHGGSGDGLASLAVDLVQRLQGGLGPDAEASHVTAGGELEKVEAVDAAQLDAGQVAEGLLDAVVGRVDDQGSAAHGVTAVTHLTLSGADLLRLVGLLHVVEGADRGQDVLGRRGLLGGFHGCLQDQGDLGDLVDGVAAGHDEGGDCGGGEGRGDRVALLVDVDLLVPLAPGLGGGEHAPSAAHVSEGTLPRAGGPPSPHAGDTGHGTSGTPRGGGDLLPRADGDGVRLALVLVHVGVDELDDVRAEGGRHDGGEGGLSGLVSGEREDAHKGTGCHGEGWVWVELPVLRIVTRKE